ncbi:MAG: hypothetical protein J5929_07305 [Eubacterium sp.]|nr:hypothetical protein [Eubacterium sp.]
MKMYGKRVAAGMVAAMTLMIFVGCGKKTEETKTEAEETTAVATEVSDQTENDATAEAVSEKEVTEEEKSEDTKPENDYEAVYAPILNEVLDAIDKGVDGTEEFKYISTGTTEAIMFGKNEDMLKRLHYMIKDISGDGVPELLIGENASYELDGTEDDSYIFEGYTCKDGKPVRFLEGWARSSYQPIDEGTFHYYGSSGAMSSGYGICHISEDGTELIWDDFYFSDGTDESNIAYYHNKTGEWDTANSEVLDMDGNEFWSKDEEIACKTLEWKTLSEYKGGSTETTETNGSGSKNVDCPISVEYADEEPSDSCIVYDPAYVDEYTTHILIKTSNDVKNFRIVTVTMEDSNDSYKFVPTECYKLDFFTVNMPIYAGMNFPGDLPNNGFIYTDENGKDRFFVIIQSGEDGSLGIAEEEL